MKESKHLEHSCNKVFPLQITPGIKWKKEANSSHWPIAGSKGREPSSRSPSWASSVSLCSSPWTTPSVPPAGWNSPFRRRAAK